MALMAEPIVKPSWNNGRWGPKGSYFYRVRDGENWGKVAAADGWSDVKAFIRYNFQTDNPYEVNWFLKNFVGCKLQTTDKKNYRFSSAASPGFVFTRNNLQPSMQPSGPVPMPEPSTEDDPIIIESPYGSPRGWFAIGGKVGGMVTTKGGDVLAMAGVSLSNPVDAFFTYGYTSRDGLGLGVSGGFSVALFYQMQHPNQLFDIPSGGPDASIALGPRLGSAGKLLVNSGALHGMARRVVSMLAGSLISSGEVYTTFLNGLKSLGQTIAGALGPRSGFEALVIDVPFGGIGTELSVYTATTRFRPVRTLTHGKSGLEDQIITW